MKHKLLREIVVLVLLMPAQWLLAQDLQIAEPFKVGTFGIEGQPVVGLVLRDSLVVELEAANAALERTGMVPTLPMPADMVGLIERYEYGLQRRTYEIVNHLVANDLLAPATRPDWIHATGAVDIMPPIMYPGKVMNAAVNFYSHVGEGGDADAQAEALRQRQANRGVPYLFYKPTRGAIIGDGDTVVIPYGRTQTDWEVELGTVIGRTAKYVTARNAQDYIFGYMVTVDISDRGGRPPGGFQGVDWFVGKGHDTFAPQGPWIVPKEFYGDPMANLRQTLSIDGEQMQEARAGDMIHSLYELMEYASSIITLYPGDVLNNGTSGGVGMGTTVRGEQRFLQAGESIEASIDGIGTLHLNVREETSVPGGTGSQLPPVSSYQ